MGLGDDSGAPRDIVAYCAQIGIRHFLVHVDRYRPDIAAKWIRFIRLLGPRAEVLMADDRVVMFRLRDELD
jgi:hypothetical protein